jgi:hypothetical protein
LNGSLTAIRRKWLLTEYDIVFLENIGLIPKNLEELIGGFYLRSDELLKKIWSLNRVEDRPLILKGEKSLFGEIVKLFGIKKNKKTQAITYEHLPRRAKNMASRIRLELSEGDKVNISWAKLIPINKRIELRNKFFDFLRAPVPDVDIEEIKKIHKPPEIHVHFKPLQRMDTKPRQMGRTLRQEIPDFQKIRCKRFFGFNYKVLSDTNGIENLPDEEFEKAENENNFIQRTLGLGFTSAGGLPLVKFCGNKVFTSPYVFNFTVGGITNEPYNDVLFSYRGTKVDEFRPSMWSTNTLNQARGKVISFGWGKINGIMYLFFKRRHQEMEAVPCVERIGLQSYGEDLMGLVGIDNSPLDPTQFGVSFIADFPNLHGNPVALYNYHWYGRSNLEKPFEVIRKIFRAFDSDIPLSVRKFYPDYPKTDSSAITIKGYGNYSLLGSRSIYKLNLEFEPQDVRIGHVSLDGTMPVLVEESYDADISLEV